MSPSVPSTKDLEVHLLHCTFKLVVEDLHEKSPSPPCASIMVEDDLVAQHIINVNPTSLITGKLAILSSKPTAAAHRKGASTSR